MKISLNCLRTTSLLEEGTHRVKIADIIEDVSGEKETHNFQCVFEDGFGNYIKDRFYNVEEQLPVIIKLFKSCGIEVTENTTLDTTELLNRNLEITVLDNIFTDEFTGEVKRIKTIVDFKSYDIDDLPY
jgi:hypothetical protein